MIYQQLYLVLCLKFNRKKDLGGGTVLDLGVYAIQFCQWIFQQVPKSITVTGTLNEEGVDDEVLAEISYGENKVGKFKISALSTLSNTAKVIGTKGQITVGQCISYFYGKILTISPFSDSDILVSPFNHRR